jgi:predicted SprT family Zn-dependent metalloprotease
MQLLHPIELSRELTLSRTEDEVEQTIIHEIAHAVVGAGHHHDGVWLAEARRRGYRGLSTCRRPSEDAIRDAESQILRQTLCSCHQMTLTASGECPFE